MTTTFIASLSPETGDSEWELKSSTSLRERLSGLFEPEVECEGNGE